MFGTSPPYLSLLCYANFDPLNILSSVVESASILHGNAAHTGLLPRGYCVRTSPVHGRQRNAPFVLRFFFLTLCF